MPDKAVIDSNIIASIAFKEKTSLNALKAVAECDPVTLDLAVAEVGNVAWKYATLTGEDKQLTFDALRDAMDFISESCVIIKSLDLADVAFKIAIENNVAFYDALFLAASIREQIPLLTLDKKMYDKVNGKANVRLI